MDKFWERYIQSRPAPGESKGAFDAFAAAHRDPGPRNMYAGGQLVRNTVDGSRPGYQGKNQQSYMTEQTNKFLKGKKKIKQSVLTKKLEEIGYVNAEEKASVFAKQKNINLIRDVTGKRPLNLAASTKELEVLFF